MLFHPEIYFKDCDECHEFVMVDGKPHTTPDGKKIKRREGEKPNCKTCEKSQVATLSARNCKTWRLFQKHRHIGLEDYERQDPLVQSHMITIGEIYEVATRNPLQGIF